MHRYNEHLSLKMTHMEFDYFASKIGLSGSDQVNFPVCFSWLNSWLFLQAAPKPLLQCVLPEVLWLGKVCSLSLQYLRLEQKAEKLWPQWQGFLLKFNKDQLPFITRQQLGIPTEHKSDFFSKTATFTLTYLNISLCHISQMWFRKMVFFPLDS